MDDAALAKARKLAAKRINERLKLLASFFNALALGVIGAGVIIPTVADMTQAWLKESRLARDRTRPTLCSTDCVHVSAQ